jgi:hypothetical protein
MEDQVELFMQFVNDSAVENLIDTVISELKSPIIIKGLRKKILASATERFKLSRIVK